MLTIAGVTISEEQVKGATHVEAAFLHFNALVQEVQASAALFSLIGHTWTGQVLEVAA